MCRSKSSLFTLEHYEGRDAPGLTPRTVQMAQTTWQRLTAAELSGVRTASELIGKVEETYGISHEQATRDVEFWCLDKQL
jgi:hypothetical protein